MQFDATFWVGAAFVVFIGVLFYFKVPGMLTKGLDERAQRIRSDLEEARRLREEAQALMASYERKQHEAAEEAKQIVQHAKEEAEREARLAAERLEAMIARREQTSLEKIAVAEAQAEKEVRDTAVAVAIAAATEVIASQVSGARADALIDEATQGLRQHLN